MTLENHADLNLVVAVLKERDALKERAEKFLASAEGSSIRVPYAVGIELLLWCRKHAVDPVAAVSACMQRFHLENADELLTAAAALKSGEVASPFDAVHLATSWHAGANLATADERLWRTRYPTLRF